MASDLNRAKRQYVEENEHLTVGDLRERLEVFDDDALVIFSETDAGNPMMFARLKHRGGSARTGRELLQIELIELTDEWYAMETGTEAEPG